MIETVLKEVFACFTSDEILITKLWADIEKHYQSPSRHYHNLNHLEHLLSILMPLKQQINEWNILLLAIAYHDIIYNVLKQNNEEKSAGYASEQLSSLLSTTESALLVNFIIATKMHEDNANADINYFTDADLAVLGADAEPYMLYTNQIRKEYGYFPPFIYKQGRKKVVKHFLSMPRIYKTDYFYNKLEAKARLNLEEELKQLAGKKSKLF